MKFDAQFLANTILLLTMLFIFRQSCIASSEYKAKNKPVVGIENANVIFMISPDDPRIGKPVVWDSRGKEFVCEGKPINIQGCAINVVIKNFGTEPALDFNFDNELLVGDTSIKTTDPDFKNCIIMPGQTMVNTPIISRETLQDAFLNIKKIKIKYTLKYTDLTKKKDLFEYFVEVVVVDKNNIAPRIVNSYFRDKRQ